MKEQEKKAEGTTSQKKAVGIIGYVALVFALLFFSGVFKNMEGPIRAMDFTVIMGKFGTIGDMGYFRGTGGFGARDGFLFAISLIPAVMLALGTVKAVEHLGGLEAAQRLLSPLLKPLLGIPGVSGLAMVASFQSCDAGASMTKILREEELLSEKEKTIFCAFQFTAGAIITNYLSSGAALFDALTVPILVPLILMLIFKFIGGNIMRFYLNKIESKNSVSGNMNKEAISYGN